MAYANVAIAPSPRPRFVLDKRLVQELTDTLYDAVREALDDYLRNGRQSVTPLAPSAPAEPLSTPLPPKELLSPSSPAIEPPTDKSNSCSIDCSPVDEPPSVQPDVPIQPIQPRLPPSYRLHVQTTTYLLLCAPCVSNTYMRCYWDALVTSIKLGALVEFRDTG
jgi:hypothetical protein